MARSPDRAAARTAGLPADEAEETCGRILVRGQETRAQHGQGQSGHQQTALKRQIDTTNRQIDQLVYELYGLTDEEIQIVEEATR